MQHRQYWLLDENVTFLNHGSFGACPKPVLAAQSYWREQLEREPVRFFMREWEGLIDRSRAQLAAFVGTDAANLVLVPNVTTGVNAILRSLVFTPNDELITTNQEYNACRNTLNYVANLSGAKVVVASIPFPVQSPEEIQEAILSCISPRTKLVLIDHIISQTGLIFPVEAIVKELNHRGIDSLIDGSHAPGMIALNLSEINATYYTGNCHKWLCAPKGAGFLYVKPDRQHLIHPTVISHGANSKRTDKSRFQLEFDWTGTSDPTPYLCIPDAINFMASLCPGGWSQLRAQNHALAVQARQLICEYLQVPIPTPDQMIGALASIPLPDHNLPGENSRLLPPLQEALWEKFKIEVPIIPWPDDRHFLIRISAQIYNTIEEYEYLAKSLPNLLLEND